MGIFRREEKKVRETIELYVSGIIEKDLDMLMSLIALDNDFLVINQNPFEKIIGAKKYYKAMDNFFLMTQDLEVNIEWMFLSVVDNMSWVNSEMIIKYVRGNMNFEEKRSMTFVLEKRRGDWFIVHIINLIEDVEEEEIVDNEVLEETEVYQFNSDDLNIELGENGVESEESDLENQ